jgi:DNA replication and repair protein RecF
MLTRLVLTHFRNHAAVTLTPGAGFVILTGENGAGKTNVLEAVSLLAPGRGLRGAALSAMARVEGPGGFGVSATLSPWRSRGGLLPQAGVEFGLATGTLAAAPERRIVRINGAPAAATALAEWVSVLWLTPAMDRLFVAPASERRRFLDRLTLALAPGHAHHAARYEAAMRARNRLLTDAAPADPEWLSALEAAMAEHGVAIDAARRALIDALTGRIEREHDVDFTRAGLALEGWAGEQQEALARALHNGRRRDAAAGRALAGPHRTELVVTHLAKRQPAGLASTGEQKALLFGIVLAHAALVADRVGRAPILLLDEVAAHLDARRRAALFARLAAGVAQVWMTGTERELFAAAPADATRLAVTPGGITPA